MRRKPLSRTGVEVSELGVGGFIGALTDDTASDTKRQDAAIAAIQSFDEPLLLIAGGASKGADFSALGTCIAKSNIRAVLLIGEEAPRIEAAMQQAGLNTTIHHCRDLTQAVATARDTAQTGDVVLLSPACASFDQFSSYAERGDLFKRLVAS